MYVGGRQWGEPSSFNPLLGWMDWPVNQINLIYETLFLFNPQTGKLEPLLGESYQVNGKSLEIGMCPPISARRLRHSPKLGTDTMTRCPTRPISSISRRGCRIA